MNHKPSQKWYARLPNVLWHLFHEEMSNRSLIRTLVQSAKSKSMRFANEETLSRLLERQSVQNPDRPFIYFGDSMFTFGEMNKKTNQMCHFFETFGLRAGDGIGIMMENRPEYLQVYFATQRLGLYAVPINTSLVGEGLVYLVNHSKIRILVLDSAHINAIEPVENKFDELDAIFFVDRPKVRKSSSKIKRFSLEGSSRQSTNSDSRWRFDPDGISTILYTSGTTGHPKGVVYHYRNDWVRRGGLLSHLIYNKDDVLYTCLPLFHANALFLTFCASLWLGLPVVLSKKFSASHFWEDVNRHHATTFNAIGVMIPILLKSKPSSKDRQNNVRLVLSAACPAQSWREFEERFGVDIWEGYSAVDGGSNFIFNLGNAPVGSIGKMSTGRYRIVDDEGQDVKAYVHGELVFHVGRRSGVLEYFRNRQATKEKLSKGLLHTGDVVYRDDKGYLYFVGRKTESMRRRGENISAYEIENVMLKHPDIMECAAFGVSAEMGEDDVMCCVVPRRGATPSPEKIAAWLDGKLARYAIPRYWRFMKELPKTATHRVMKNSLKEMGVTDDTIDLLSRGTEDGTG